VAVLARKIGRRGHGPMESAAARTYSGGLVRGSGGEASLKLKHFWFLDV